jgi:hypothetical protein
MVMNKKGWLRIVEAVVAIIIVFGVVVVIISNQSNKYEPTDKIYEKQLQILDIVTKNDTLREMILAENTVNINEVIVKMIPPNWNFSTCICNISDVCGVQTPIDRNIYVKETFVTSTLTQYNPKKIRFFVWAKD